MDSVLFGLHEEQKGFLVGVNELRRDSSSYGEKIGCGQIL